MADKKENVHTIDDIVLINDVVLNIIDFLVIFSPNFFLLWFYRLFNYLFTFYAIEH